MPALTNDAILAAAELLGVQTLPHVLGVGPRQDRIDAFLAARTAALDGLRTARLLDRYGDLDSDLAAALHILAQPERELATRIHTASGVRRICLARRGTGHVVAVRTDDTFELATGWGGDAAGLARPVLDALGPRPPAAVPTFSAPVDRLRERLDAARTAADYTQICYGLGVEERAAIGFGLAMSGCLAHAEIVAYTHANGATRAAPGAVAIYDTHRGRIVAGPNVAADHTIWTTFSPGTDHRVAHAVTRLVETLPGGRWMP
ncbi:ESX secretion-associated protein EspG [Nocardia sp. BMG111209]|uniref:ESX secretion-associated protein EspG n=1 Tax=Nocardia sp. BMG111209 TaxID=1160137 RepID=UPI000378BCB7|nr:ESX secretion-associated protein EspG [Nocardia sp. BMG111209]